MYHHYLSIILYSKNSKNQLSNEIFSHLIAIFIKIKWIFIKISTINYLFNSLIRLVNAIGKTSFNSFLNLL